MKHFIVGLVGVCLGLCVASGCSFGGTNAKLNTGKIQTTRKVAVAGICLQKQVGAVRGTKDVGVFQGGGAKMLLDPMVASIQASLPGEWKGVEVLPLAAADAAARPEGEHRVCANGVDPMTPGGFLGAPDKAYLSGLATKLGVDAVLVISGNPTIRFFDGKGAKAYVASIGSGFELTLIDRAGEDIASIHLKDFETEYFAETGPGAADASKLGDSLGKLVAKGFVATVRGETFAPPSKPGMTGL